MTAKTYKTSIIICTIILLWGSNLFAQKTSFRELAASGDNVFAITATEMGRGELFRITEDGKNWKVVNESFISVLLIDIKVKDSIVFVLGEKGEMYFSKDLGDNWTQINNGLTKMINRSDQYSSIAINGSKFFAISESILYECKMSDLIWTKSESAPRALKIFCLEDKIFLTQDSRKVFLSEDGGSTWNEKAGNGLNLYAGDQFHSMMIHNSTLYASSHYSNSYISKDNGENWTMTNFKRVAHINSYTSIGSVLFAAVYDQTGSCNSNSESDGFYFLDNNYIENFWIRKNNFSPIRAVVASGKYVYIARFYDGLFRSSNNGAYWEPVRMRKDTAQYNKLDAEAKNKWETDVKSRTENDSIEKLKFVELAKQDAVRFAKEVEIEVAHKKQLKDAKNKADRKIIFENYFRGLAELSYNNLDSSLQRLNQAIKIRGDFTDAYKARAKCYHRMKRFDDEKKDSLEIIQLNLSSNGKVQTEDDLGFAVDLKEWGKEIADKKSDFYLNCYYKDDNAWYEYGLLGGNFYKSAIYCLSNAITLNNTKAEYYIARGNAYNEIFKTDLAMEDFNAAKKLNKKCKWYSFEVTQDPQTCSVCKGTGTVLVVSIKQQEVNGTNTGSSSSGQEDCTYCVNGTVSSTKTLKALKMPE